MELIFTCVHVCVYVYVYVCVCVCVCMCMCGCVWVWVWGRKMVKESSLVSVANRGVIIPTVAPCKGSSRGCLVLKKSIIYWQYAEVYKHDTRLTHLVYWQYAEVYKHDTILTHLVYWQYAEVYKHDTVVYKIDSLDILTFPTGDCIKIHFDEYLRKQWLFMQKPKKCVKPSSKIYKLAFGICHSNKLPH